MRTSSAIAVLAAGLGVAVAGCRAGSQPSPSAFPVLEAKARVLASQSSACPDRARAEAGAVAFRAKDAWDDHLAELAPPARAALADWRPGFDAGESVVLARAGELPNPGYRIVVEESDLPIRAGVLGLRLTAIPPPRERLQAQVMTPACLYLWLDRADYRDVAVELAR